MHGVGEHDRCKFACRRGGVDRPAKALLDKSGKEAAVIDVNVGKANRFDFVGRNQGRIPIALLVWTLLKEAVVDYQLFPGGFEAVA